MKGLLQWTVIFILFVFVIHSDMHFVVFDSDFMTEPYAMDDPMKRGACCSENFRLRLNCLARLLVLQFVE